MEAGSSTLQTQVAESIAVFFTDPGDQSVLEGKMYQTNSTALVEHMQIYR